MMDRQPKPDDLIVPTRNGTTRDATEAQRQLIADLELLGYRTKAGKRQHRRGHDMRRTFITLARTDGASKDILRWVTHGPTPSEMMDLYSSFDGATLCAEVAKLKITLVEGKLLAMPIAIAASSGGDKANRVPTKAGSDGEAAKRVPALSLPTKTLGTVDEKVRPRRGSSQSGPRSASSS